MPGRRELYLCVVSIRPQYEQFDDLMLPELVGGADGSFRRRRVSIQRRFHTNLDAIHVLEEMKRYPVRRRKGRAIPSILDSQ